tara:strand:- start:10 stop:798 length:789 start_codon:yes stop_codon:yes gene_type:complete
MTNPEERNDPWKESLSCYEDFGDEVVITGDDWPFEFKWDYLSKVIQEGFDKCTGDWAIHMPIDYIFHEDDFKKIKNKLKNNLDSPAVAFPQHQIFTPDKYFMQSKICIALNKKKFPNIKMNGGGDLCLPTLDNKRITADNVPQTNTPIWNYDKVFGTKETISIDRARFARAWYRQFNDWGIFGGPEPEEAFSAWIDMIESRYKKHVLKLKLEQHPKYIADKLYDLKPNQFGFDAFGLKDNIKSNYIDYIKSYKNRLLQIRYT